MGLNRMMMMKNGEVKVEDGSKTWKPTELGYKTISFTVPPGVKRIEVVARVAMIAEPERKFYISITNTSNDKSWGEGWCKNDSDGHIDYSQDIHSIIGVTPNKTYSLLFDCFNTNGVTFSWSKAINAMTPTVEDY